MQIKENTIFDEHYRLVRLLGSGGFSEVWLAKDLSVGSLEVALKVYAPGGGMDELSAKSFIEEFRLAYNLHHTNLLSATSYGVFNRMPYLILPFCEHGSSSRLTGNMAEDDVWSFLHDVAAGLAYMHKQSTPVIHQDIKPANVLIGKDGTYMITDFGVSTKAHSTLRKSVSGGNSSGGTPAYMAPERFGKTPTPIKASDVWALGASLFELVTGDVPFGDMGGVMQKSGAEIPLIKKGISKDLKTIIKRCLQKETWDRPTAEEILKWTRQHENKEKIRFGKGLEKSTKMILLASVAVAIIAAAVVFVGIHSGQGKSKQVQQLLIEADAAFAKAKYDEAFGGYRAVKNLDASNTVGYTKFLKQAHILIEIVGYDKNVKELLLKAQGLKDTPEVRNLIDKCNQN